MFKTDGMNKRSAIKYLETKYDLLEEQHNKLVDRMELESINNEFKDYGLEVCKCFGYTIFDYEQENPLLYTAKTIQEAKQRFEGYKKGFEQPIDILIEETEEECPCKAKPAKKSK